MNDLVVVLPGIMGSVLQRDGKEVWGIGGATILQNLLSLGRPLQDLRLPDDVGDELPGDATIATRLLPSAQLIPGFWNLIDGYSELIQFLEGRFELTRSKGAVVGNLVLFPYDWRLSNRINGQLLAAAVIPALRRWQRAGNPGAKINFICHSMGGLVARWFLEVLGGGEFTRSLITMGTPFSGSINALDCLSNGFARGIGPLQFRLDAVLRSFPSVYQLLPAYACIENQSGGLDQLTSVTIPKVGADRILDARMFHDQISDSAATNPSTYRIHALKGLAQPTYQTARISGNSLTPIRSYQGEDLGGDGTVPRQSAHPREWESEERCAYFSQRHGSLQADESLLVQIAGILSERPIRFMAPMVHLSLEMPELIKAGTELRVEAKIQPDLAQPVLRAELCTEGGQKLTSRLMSFGENRSYHVAFSDLPPGGYKVTVSEVGQSDLVDPVSGIALIWASESLIDGNGIS